MMTSRIIGTIELAVVFLMCLIPVYCAAEAQGRSGNKSAEILEIPLTAQTSSLAATGVAGEKNIFSMTLNPAAFPIAYKYSAAFGRQDLAMDLNQNYIIVGHSLYHNGYMAFECRYTDLGSQTRTRFDVIGPAGRFDNSHVSVQATYGYRLHRLIQAGGSVRLLREKLDDVEAYGIAVDAGMYFNTPLKGLTAGFSLKNLGTPLQFEQQNFPLPTVVQAGAAYSCWGDRLLFLADIKKLHYEELHLNAGIQFRPFPVIAFRAGYNGEIEAATWFTCGLGLTWERFQFDYAFADRGGFGNQHTVNCGVIFY